MSKPKEGFEGNSSQGISDSSIEGVKNEVESSDIDEFYEMKLEYAHLIDKYHQLFKKVKNLMRLHRDQFKIDDADKERDDVHKKLEELGLKLGKSKDRVLGDIMRREGNLAEYGLPSYGIIGAEDLFDSFNFGAFNVNKSEDSFSREALEYSGIVNRIRQNIKDEEIVRDIPVLVEVPNIGKVEHVRGLKEDEIGIIFTSTFTTDVYQDPIEIRSAEFYEKWRRAVQAAQEFSVKPMRLFSGAYHETVTLVGVAIPAEDLNRFTTFLRNHQDKYSNESETIPKKIISRDRELAIKDIKSQYGDGKIFREYLKLREQYFGEKIKNKKKIVSRSRRRRGYFDDEEY